MTVDGAWWATVFGEDISESADGNYLVFPNHSDPRVVVDRTCAIGVNEALARALMNRRVPTPLAGSLASLLRPLLAARQPAWQIADRTESSLRASLSAVLEREIQLSVAVGPPRPNRKPVVRCYSEGSLVAVAKIGPDAHTADMVRNESRWLERLSERGVTSFVLPELLHAGAFGASPLLVMSALELGGEPSTAFAAMPHHLLDDAFAGFDDHSFVESPWRRDLRSRIERLSSPGLMQRFDALTNEADATKLATRPWHGDWSPWNVGRSTSGHWCIWDWERAAEGAPIGFDLLHLHSTYGPATGDTPSRDTALEEAGVKAEHLSLTEALYELERSVRVAESKTPAELRSN